MQSATTTEARLAAQQTYQEGFRKLQQDMQTKTTAIRNKWQPGQATVNPPPASAQTNANSEATTAAVADQQKMNAELQALSASYMQRIQILGDSLKQDLQTVASTDERNRLLQSYQEQLLQLQQQAQAETRAIRERYQQQQ